MNISELNGICKNREIYIIGTGPSLRLIPKNFFRDKVRIGLNNAHKVIKCDLNLTIHPELIPENYENDLKIFWITKRKGRLSEPSELQIQRTYWFSNNKNVFDYEYLTATDDRLYVGRGIQTAGLALAAKMGASTAVLVGCDMTDLCHDHHATAQPVQFHGLPAFDVYREYYVNTALVRKKLKEEFGMETVSINPFLGLGYEQEDYKRLLEENNLSSFPSPEDISEYTRKKPDFQ